MAATTTERPILMSAEMVRAVLDGMKSQTRRVVNPQPPKWCDRYSPSMARAGWLPSGEYIKDEAGFLTGRPCVARMNGDPVRCPFGIPGDRLWVREAWGISAKRGAAGFRPGQWLEGEYELLRRDVPLTFHYRATEDGTGHWRPSIHMPRIASRLTLEVTDVRVERLQKISHRDALAEGVAYDVSKVDGSPLARFEKLWNGVNGKRPGCAWAGNPFVWAISFRRINP